MKDINAAEDSEEFDALLERTEHRPPEGRDGLHSRSRHWLRQELGYPVLVRPCYVLGGQGMEIAWSDADITEYMAIINGNEQEHPILVDKYLLGKEIEVDAICDGKDMLIPGIMEHIERAGIHSGDSISVYPAFTPHRAPSKSKIIEYTGDALP